MDPLLALLDHRNIGILDGGLATYLEDGLGFDLSKGPLWSARLLDEKEEDVSQGKGCQGILDAHSHYLEAGAAVIGTATYQASTESFLRAGYDDARAQQLMNKAVHIAAQANQEAQARALVSLSLGPYGAMLSNGSEYTGDYRPTYLPSGDERREKQPTLQELSDFHRRRMETFLRDAKAWEAIGVVAVETVPRLDEGMAFRMALEELADTAQQKPAYVSFAYQNDSTLPWPANEPDALEDLLYSLLSTEVHGKPSRWPVAGIGINCTKPYLMSKLVQRWTSALRKLNLPVEQGGKALADQRQKADLEVPLLFLYPDGGLHYDPVKKIWLQLEDSQGGQSSADSWAQGLMKIAHAAASEQGAWRGVFVGGCCKSGTQEIKALCRCR